MLPAGAATTGKTAPQLFPTEAEAEQHCPADIVVWLDTMTGVYHFRGQQWYGSTKSGGYACKLEADKQGYRRNKSGK